MYFHKHFKSLSWLQNHQRITTQLTVSSKGSQLGQRCYENWIFPQQIGSWTRSLSIQSSKLMNESRRLRWNDNDNIMQRPRWTTKNNYHIRQLLALDNSLLSETKPWETSKTTLSNRKLIVSPTQTVIYFIRIDEAFLVFNCIVDSQWCVQSTLADLAGRILSSGELGVWGVLWPVENVGVWKTESFRERILSKKMYRLDWSMVGGFHEQTLFIQS